MEPPSGEWQPTPIPGSRSESPRKEESAKTERPPSPVLRLDQDELKALMEVLPQTEKPRLTRILQGKKETLSEQSALKIATAAARTGNLDVLKLMHGKFPVGEAICDAAAEAVDPLEVLQWARENGYPITERTTGRLAYEGKLDALKWAKNEGIPLSPDVGKEAAYEGHLDVLKWARSEGHLPDDAAITYPLALKGNLTALRWAESEKLPLDPNLCAAAAASGKPDVLKWARAHQLPWNDALEVAFHHGAVDVADWALRNGATCNKGHAYLHSLANGNPTMEKWFESKDVLFRMMDKMINAKEYFPPLAAMFYQDRVAVTKESANAIASAAAQIGMVKPLELFDHVLDRSAQICAEAAKSGKLEVLEWAHAHGHPINQGVIYGGAISNSPNILKWGKERGLSLDRACEAAAAHNSWAAMEWLSENGAPWGNTLLEALGHGNLSMAMGAFDLGARDDDPERLRRVASQITDPNLREQAEIWLSIAFPEP